MEYSGQDEKYGNVTADNATFHPDEPVVIFRAQDGLSVETLKVYRVLCEKMGSPEGHLDTIDLAINRFSEWQEINPELVKIPD